MPCWICVRIHMYECLYVFPKLKERLYTDYVHTWFEEINAGPSSLMCGCSRKERGWTIVVDNGKKCDQYERWCFHFHIFMSTLVVDLNQHWYCNRDHYTTHAITQWDFGTLKNIMCWETYMYNNNSTYCMHCMRVGNSSSIFQVHGQANSQAVHVQEGKK